MTPEWHEECFTLRKQGMSQADIARRLGKSHGTIAWVLDEHGERDKQRTRNKARWDREKPLNGADRYWRVTACRRLRGQGVSIPILMERFGRSETWVKTALRIKDEPMSEPAPRTVKLRAVKPIPDADRNTINLAAAKAFAAGYIDAAELRRRLV